MTPERRGEIYGLAIDGANKAGLPRDMAQAIIECLDEIDDQRRVIADMASGIDGVAEIANARRERLNDHFGRKRGGK